MYATSGTSVLNKREKKEELAKKGEKMQKGQKVCL